MHFKTDSMA